MMPKEKDYRGKLLRLFRTLMLLYRSPKGLSVQEIAEELGVTYRTVYRDFLLLEKVGFPPEEVEKGKYLLLGFQPELNEWANALRFNLAEAGLLTQAMTTVNVQHPLRKGILEKLKAFAGSERTVSAELETEASEKIEQLNQAIREQKQVTLYNYRSANSQSISNRLIEPYGFSEDGRFLKAFEISSQMNKTYKLDRIEEVLSEPISWQYKNEHTPIAKEDLFGMRASQMLPLQLQMSLRAAQLLQEEYPAARQYIFRINAKTYRFEAQVAGWEVIGRFVLGLPDEIEVLAPDTFLKYLHEKIKNKKF